MRILSRCVGWVHNGLQRTKRSAWNTVREVRSTNHRPRSALSKAWSTEGGLRDLRRRECPVLSGPCSVQLVSQTAINGLCSVDRLFDLLQVGELFLTTLL